jgi:hypothetical protein
MDQCRQWKDRPPGMLQDPPSFCNIPDIKSMHNRNKMLEMEDEQQYNQNNTTIILK